MAVVLDPREARPLTSREIAKVLLGVLGGVAAHDPEVQRSGDLRKAIKKADPRAVCELRRPVTWMVAFRATVAGLRGWCDEREVNTALAWLDENVQKIFPPGAPVSSMN